MNATKWPSLTEFAKHLGREGICRVEETDKGLHVAWIDNSPDALRRQDAIRKRERQDKGDEEREQLLIREQVKRARHDAEARGAFDDGEEGGELKRAEGEKIKLSFGAKPVPKMETAAEKASTDDGSTSTAAPNADPSEKGKDLEDGDPEVKSDKETTPAEPVAPAKVLLKMGFSSKPKNVFAVAKKNAFGGKKAAVIEQPKKMSEAERIMKEEIERKQKRDSSGFGGPSQKRQRF